MRRFHFLTAIALFLMIAACNSSQKRNETETKAAYHDSTVWVPFHWLRSAIENEGDTVRLGNVWEDMVLEHRLEFEDKNRLQWSFTTSHSYPVRHQRGEVTGIRFYRYNSNTFSQIMKITDSIFIPVEAYIRIREICAKDSTLYTAAATYIFRNGAKVSPPDKKYASGLAVSTTYKKVIYQFVARNDTGRIYAYFISPKGSGYLTMYFLPNGKIVTNGVTDNQVNAAKEALASLVQL